MEQMQIISTQYLIVLHRDRAHLHPHLHIVTINLEIDLHGPIIPLVSR
ncbi:relaxase/mobilization nuclease domain-containing protein [Pontibacter sp. HSC-14F20]|nr:relaxase/mobilization nuclease domain-containing protein [Pontibacter sp. HSC-14F20]MBX0335354.1 relaxase/mobilization nuclease domain-containing protein [Pontibacter sp. HSC-14F20]